MLAAVPAQLDDEADEHYRSLRAVLEEMVCVCVCVAVAVAVAVAVTVAVAVAVTVAVKL